MYLYPHCSAARAHGQKKDNGLILALQVLFLNLGRLNFRRLCLFNSKSDFPVAPFDWHSSIEWLAIANKGISMTDAYCPIDVHSSVLSCRSLIFIHGFFDRSAVELLCLKLLITCYWRVNHEGCYCHELCPFFKGCGFWISRLWHFHLQPWPIGS